jgi:hypothetical protein
MLSRNTFEEWFIEAVKLDFTIDPELKSALLEKKHPKVEAMLTNLYKELQQACFHLYQKKGRYPLPQTIKGVVYDFTKTFTQGLEIKAKQMYESDLSRIARETKIQEHKDLEATANGNAQGIFAEAGVMINDQTKTDQKTI